MSITSGPQTQELSNDYSDEIIAAVFLLPVIQCVYFFIINILIIIIMTNMAIALNIATNMNYAHIMA